MKKILFLIHDLGPGGAEKVLVNLVNNLDREKFDVTVMSMFDVGVNKQFLAPHVKYRYCFKRMFRGNSHIMKLFSPNILHKWFIKDNRFTRLLNPFYLNNLSCHECDHTTLHNLTSRSSPDSLERCKEHGQPVRDKRSLWLNTIKPFQILEINLVVLLVARKNPHHDLMNKPQTRVSEFVVILIPDPKLCTCRIKPKSHKT